METKLSLSDMVDYFIKLTLFLILCAFFTHVDSARADPLDWLVQRVCDNGSGGHTAADPVTCPGQARPLRIGEALPYHKWDGTNANTAIQISDSYPIADLSNNVRVVANEFFDSQTSFAEPTFDASNPTTGRTGYDLLIADGNYVSGAGTNDPGGGWQPFWGNSSCSLVDTWVFFPKGGATGFGDTLSSLTASSPQCPTVTGFGQAYTAWNFYPGMAYESGKNLDTIKSFHFGGNSVNAGSIEEFYFTKEYGRTRWEAWSSARSGPDPVALARCPTGISGGMATFGTTTYYLVDCHDWSNVVAAPSGDWDPATHWHVDPLYNSTNLLKNTHMECTSSAGVAAVCGSGGTCQTIYPWNRTGDLNWGYDQQLQSPKATANCALQLSIPSAPSGQSVYQDVTSFPAGYTNYTFGTALWIPQNHGTTAQATVTLFEVASNGTVLAQHAVPATLTNVPQYFQMAFTKNPSTAWMRFQIYTGTQGVFYEFTESWLAPAP